MSVTSELGRLTQLKTQALGGKLVLTNKLVPSPVRDLVSKDRGDLQRKHPTWTSAFHTQGSQTWTNIIQEHTEDYV